MAGRRWGRKFGGADVIRGMGMIDEHLNAIEENIYSDKVGRRLIGLADSFLGVYRTRCIIG